MSDEGPLDENPEEQEEVEFDPSDPRCWEEVLGGLDAGTRYVTTNSYLVKADIEKSGASHDH